MDLKLYNTLSRKKEVFKPLKKGVVSIYSCGPTPYDFVHIGNLRTYLFQDILKRVLQKNEYQINHVMNITNVDDKTIAGARAAGISLKELTSKYETAFIQDLKKLNIILPNTFTRATEYIPEMIHIIQKLITREYAYEKDGSVYYDVSAFKPYGKLAHLDKKGLKAGARVDVDEYSKEEVQDFVLWKQQKPDEPAWDSPFGKGRPGWHIECSAMSMKELGETFDIHAGAVDLIFPHHENEIAQSEGATGKPFVTYWIHGEHLLVDKEKMSKSLHNMFTLQDIEEKKFSPLDFRYLTLGAHYRTPLNFTWEALRAAKKTRKELCQFVRDLYEKGVRNEETPPHTDYKSEFMEALNNDLNAPQALGVVWKFIKEYRTEKLTSREEVLSTLLWFDEILGLNLKEALEEKEIIPPRVQALLKERSYLRDQKEWTEADAVRDKIAVLGWVVEDTSDGQKARKIS